MSESKEKNECGFLQVDNQILDLLLCDTQLNVYGILMLSKIREYSRKRVQCFISNATFAKMYKTSESMIKRQITELYNLGLIESTVSLNDGSRGKIRLLKIPRNYTKVLSKILQTKEYLDLTFKGQNSTLTSNLTLETDTKNETFKGQNQGSNIDFEPRTDNTFKGQNLDLLGSNYTFFKGHSDPITIDSPNNSIINNKLLEDNTSSPASSTDDLWNATDSENVGIPSVIDDTNFDTIFDAVLNQQREDDSEVENPNQPKRKPNHVYDEATVWYHTQLNPISRYNYEVKYKSAAMNFAWGERARKDNQKHYYTVDQILEYFTKENQLEYLEQIGWIDTHRNYLEEIKWEHLWMFPAKENI